MCGGSGNYKQLLKNCKGIDEVRQMSTPGGGKLNPEWVEALMGFPNGWTDIDGKPASAAAADYPARWLSGTWEDDVPRVVPDVKNRLARLRCLGNAIVPQIAAYLWGLLPNVPRRRLNKTRTRNVVPAQCIFNALKGGCYTLAELSEICGKSYAATRVLVDTLSLTYPIYETGRLYGLLNTG
jgi:hypothetical protein